MNTYVPYIINTSAITLQNDIMELGELLACNIHDNWAAQRIKDGWIYGSQRDDNLKHHPCLVPYEELLESEKEFDRIACIETLKAIIALGYSIQRLRQ